VALLLPAALIGSIFTPVLFASHGVGLFPLLLVVFTGQQVGLVSYAIFLAISSVAYVVLLQGMEEPTDSAMLTLRSISPTGAFAVRVHPWEATEGIVVEPPEITDTRSKESILRVTDDFWSLSSAQWRSASVVCLKLCKYPGDHAPPEVDVVVDCIKLNAQVNGGVVEPIGKVPGSLERFYVAHQLRNA
jgi:hypothetical protein